MTRDVKALAECIIKICDAVRNLQDPCSATRTTNKGSKVSDRCQ